MPIDEKMLVRLHIDFPRKKINRSHTHTPTENNTPDTHTRQEQHLKPPNEHPPQTLKLPRVNVNITTLSLDARLFPSVVVAVAPAVAMGEASSLSWRI